ncbi:hypothetical protein COLO4_22246 [Corchorus olitorius]|uniref:KIB1-4 beta-propeller domain-containing protein n=1 Tax=Corchorus olitorius TaxID=93759 RepID=A0A1R3IN77_9ROSI|nr:hypothetical protein COLO4_22246 [Corchorus olitorius]
METDNYDMESWLSRLSGLLPDDGETTTTAVDEERPRHSLPPLKSQPYPWLITSHGKYYQTQTFFGVSKLHQYHTRIIPEMRNRRIFHASFGWLVLVNRDSISDFLLVNLTSMQTIQIPDPPEHVKGSTMCILTAPPMDPNCRIIFNDFLSDDFMFCRPGIDSEFTRQKLCNGFGTVTSCITIGGNTYCWTSLIPLKGERDVNQREKKG